MVVWGVDVVVGVSFPVLCVQNGHGVLCVKLVLQICTVYVSR